ncbi:MAG: HD domain-containing protein [Syntrophobacterales bacterium]|nr:HD domain-containing protein [Syntrophobacterales bacterium]
MHADYTHIFKLAQPYLNVRRNDIHTEIVYRSACRLLESEPGDPSIIIPAVICHDIGWSQVPEELHLKAFGPNSDPALTRLHEIAGAKLARDILLAIAYEPKKSVEIIAIIEGHDTRSTALSASDKIVKDADKLFRFDKSGMEIDANRFQIKITNHANWLEQQIEKWFFTETGKKLAQEALARFRQQRH